VISFKKDANLKKWILPYLVALKQGGKREILKKNE